MPKIKKTALLEKLKKEVSGSNRQLKDDTSKYIEELKQRTFGDLSLEQRMQQKIALDEKIKRLKIKLGEKDIDDETKLKIKIKLSNMKYQRAMITPVFVGASLKLLKSARGNLLQFEKIDKLKRDIEIDKLKRDIEKAIEILNKHIEFIKQGVRVTAADENPNHRDPYYWYLIAKKKTTDRKFDDANIAFEKAIALLNDGNYYTSLPKGLDINRLDVSQEEMAKLADEILFCSDYAYFLLHANQKPAAKKQLKTAKLDIIKLLRLRWDHVIKKSLFKNNQVFFSFILNSPALPYLLDALLKDGQYDVVSYLTFTFIDTTSVKKIHHKRLEKGIEQIYIRSYAVFSYAVSIGQKKWGLPIDSVQIKHVSSSSDNNFAIILKDSKELLRLGCISSDDHEANILLFKQLQQTKGDLNQVKELAKTIIPPRYLAIDKAKIKKFSLKINDNGEETNSNKEADLKISASTNGVVLQVPNLQGPNFNPNFILPKGDEKFSTREKYATTNRVVGVVMIVFMAWAFMQLFKWIIKPLFDKVVRGGEPKEEIKETDRRNIKQPKKLELAVDNETELELLKSIKLENDRKKQEEKKQQKAASVKETEQETKQSKLQQTLEELQAEKQRQEDQQAIEEEWKRKKKQQEAELKKNNKPFDKKPKKKKFKKVPVKPGVKEKTQAPVKTNRQKLAQSGINSNKNEINERPSTDKKEIGLPKAVRVHGSKIGGYVPGCEELNGNTFYKPPINKNSKEESLFVSNDFFIGNIYYAIIKYADQQNYKFIQNEKSVVINIEIAYGLLHEMISILERKSKLSDDPNYKYSQQEKFAQKYFKQLACFRHTMVHQGLTYLCCGVMDDKQLAQLEQLLKRYIIQFYNIISVGYNFESLENSGKIATALSVINTLNDEDNLKKVLNGLVLKKTLEQHFQNLLITIQASCDEVVKAIDHQGNDVIFYESLVKMNIQALINVNKKLVANNNKQYEELIKTIERNLTPIRNKWMHEPTAIRCYFADISKNVQSALKVTNEQQKNNEPRATHCKV